MATSTCHVLKVSDAKVHFARQSIVAWNYVVRRGAKTIVEFNT